MRKIVLYLIFVFTCAFGIDSVHAKVCGEDNSAKSEDIIKASPERDLFEELAKSIKYGSIELPQIPLMQNVLQKQKSFSKYKNKDEHNRLFNIHNNINRNINRCPKKFFIVAAESKIPVDYYVFALRQILI